VKVGGLFEKPCRPSESKQGAWYILVSPAQNPDLAIYEILSGERML
jgi:hypothetical protein